MKTFYKWMMLVAVASILPHMATAQKKQKAEEKPEDASREPEKKDDKVDETTEETDK